MGNRQARSVASQGQAKRETALTSRGKLQGQGKWKKQTTMSVTGTQEKPGVALRTGRLKMQAPMASDR